MPKIIVGVLRGGTSTRYDESIVRGARILHTLPEEKYDTRDIFIDKKGDWHMRGIPMQPMRALSQLDVALNTIEGNNGEDGMITRIIEQSNIPYVGSNAKNSSLASQKNQMRQQLLQNGISVPQGIFFSVSDEIASSEMARMVHGQMAPPYIIKPNRGQQSEGIQYVSSFVDLVPMIDWALKTYGSFMVEEYIKGEEATATVVDGYRYQTQYVFPVAQIKRPDGAKYISQAHHKKNMIEHTAPSRFTMDQKKQMEETARSVHTALGLRHISHIDFIVTPRRSYVLGARTTTHIVGEKSPLFSMLESVGSNQLELLEHLIQIAKK